MDYKQVSQKTIAQFYNVDRDIVIVTVKIINLDQFFGFGRHK